MCLQLPPVMRSLFTSCSGTTAKRRVITKLMQVSRQRRKLFLSWSCSRASLIGWWLSGSLPWVDWILSPTGLISPESWSVISWDRLVANCLSVWQNASEQVLVSAAGPRGAEGEIRVHAAYIIVNVVVMNGLLPSLRHILHNPRDVDRLQLCTYFQTHDAILICCKHNWVIKWKMKSSGSRNSNSWRSCFF